MKLYVIAAMHEAEPDAPWIVDVWDEWTVDENGAGFREALDKAVKDAGPKTDVRMGEVEVPDSFLTDMFKPHSVTGKVVKLDE